MENFNNFELFIDNLSEKEKPNKKIMHLESFTIQANILDQIQKRIMHIKNISKDKEGYNFKYGKNKYQFEILSEKDTLQEVDKKCLNSFERYKLGLVRTLKLACSLDLNDPKIIITSDILNKISGIITYKNYEEEKVIDYKRNIIMNKEDYYKIFCVKEINSLSKKDLYTIYYLINNINKINEYELIIFSKEILNDLSKNFKYLSEKYNNIGINKANLLLWGNDADDLFFSDMDGENMPYESIRKSLDTFTLNPDNKQNNIEKLTSQNEYIFNNDEIGSFKFKLISDNVCGSIKDELLSENRYGNCHHNVYKLASIFSEEEQRNTSIVAGSFMVNDKDSFNHSWLEIENDDKTTVWDYNNNLIIDKNIYYKLYGIKKISKTNLEKVVKIAQLIDSTNIMFHPIEINYFSEEIYSDFMKNSKLLMKK